MDDGAPTRASGWGWLFATGVFGLAVYLADRGDGAFTKGGDLELLGPTLLAAVLIGILGSFVGHNLPLGTKKGFWWGAPLGAVGLLIVNTA